MNSDDLNWFKKHMARDRLLFLEGGVGLDLQDYPVLGPSQRGPLRLLWAGEFSSRKRPLEMIDVANILRESGFDFNLTMLGDGPLRDQVNAEIRSKGLSDAVDTPGHSEIQRYMEWCQVFVHTSKWEGLPRVMLEAIAMGRPTVGFDVKGVRDIPLVALVSDGDLESMATRIIAASRAEPLDFGALSEIRHKLDARNAADQIACFASRILEDQTLV